MFDIWFLLIMVQLVLIFNPVYVWPTGISVSETISPGMFGWWEGRQELCPSGVPRYLAYIVQFSPSGETEMDSAHSDFEAPW